MTSKEFKKQSNNRIALVCAICVGCCILVLGKILYLNVSGAEKRQSYEKIDNRIVSGVRGDILSDDLQPLATTVTSYNPYWDSRRVSKKVFDKNIDSLAYKLDSLFAYRKLEKSFREKLVNTHQKQGQMFLPKRLGVDELNALKTFPIFRKGRMNGGFVENSQNERRVPFESLAKRTIGYEKEILDENNDKKTIRRGLEQSYHDVLKPEKRLMVMEHIKNIGWVSAYDASGTPKRGKDIQTTINIHMQDIAEKALRKQLVKHQATYGCAVVMEVETGQIKAMANLQVSKDGQSYNEDYNFAVGKASPPGSTQKIATLLALLEETNVSLEEKIYVGKGYKNYHGFEVHDSKRPESEYLSLRKIMEKSSNVGTTEFAMKYFGDVVGGDKRFREKFDDFLLSQKTGIDIIGEPQPYVRKQGEEGWSAISVPWMAYGYESEITPLQTLAFYNAIANNGKYMKPYLVSKILDNNNVVKQIEPEMVKQICSEESAKLAKEVLIGVVNNGTATNLKLSNLQLAGKTGTAKLEENPGIGYKHIYQASFAGFFPAENPKYSCIVLVNQPTKDGYYGNQVAGPVFKEIAEKYYLNRETPKVLFSELEQSHNINSNPDCKVAYAQDLQTTLEYIGVPFGVKTDKDWVVADDENYGLSLLGRDFYDSQKVPNVRGMGLKDAIYILELFGLNVEFENYGKVVSQSITPGSRFNSGDIIKIRLQ